jgi:A/G-specific adenine glycosylase
MASDQWVAKLLKWFEKNGVNYPFRYTSDPYRILISEILLRQTTAKQVATIYGRFFKQYPNPYALMEASNSELKKVIKPLGIASRARILKQIARDLVNEFQGQVPKDMESLIRLGGVGRYIASCVLTFGFNKPTPMVDVNVMRVLSRIYQIPIDKAHSEQYWVLYTRIAPYKKVHQFHYALIDLAHLLCKTRKPFCQVCPIRPHCIYARSHGYGSRIRRRPKL